MEYIDFTAPLAPNFRQVDWKAIGLPQVTFQRGKGFKKGIGKTLGEDRQERVKIWWLGPNEKDARELAQFITAVWQDVQTTTGAKHWTPAGLAWAQRIIRQLRDSISSSVKLAHSTIERHAPARSTPSPRIAANPTITATMLHAALDQYIKAMKGKALSDSYRRRVEETIGDLKRYRRDVPLAGIDRVWLESLTDEIKSRPRGRRKNKASGKREPIKPMTVRTSLQHWRQAFDWLDRASDSNRFGGWEAPKRMNDLFSVDLAKLRTKAERDAAADGPEQIPIDDIVKLYKAIDQDRHRAWFLCGLFAGQGQTELSVARRDEFDLDAATFTHRRNKTSQRGVYWVPPELVGLLRILFTTSDKEGLAFRTREGSKLVDGQSDCVRQAWYDWRQRAEVTGYGFYSLRRFFSHRAALKGGDSLRDAALAHSAKSVGGKHYSNHRDFQAVAEVGRELHAELLAKGMFEPKAETE